MPHTYLCPFLMFTGDCKQAMEFYHECLGGKLEIHTFGESPVPSSDAQKSKIMHSMLEHDWLTIMASDEQEGATLVKGDNIHLSLVGDEETKLTDAFNKLSTGGKVTLPLAKQFWGDTYGMFIDKFGIRWTVNITGEKS